jgi:hypothetical protein
MGTERTGGPREGLRRGGMTRGAPKQRPRPMLVQLSGLSHT